MGQEILKKLKCTFLIQFPEQDEMASKPKWWKPFEPIDYQRRCQRNCRLSRDAFPRQLCYYDTIKKFREVI